MYDITGAEDTQKQGPGFNYSPVQKVEYIVLTYDGGSKQPNRQVPLAFETGYDPIKARTPKFKPKSILGRYFR